jgi:hypothetical protein
MLKHGKNRRDEIVIKIVVAKHERKREREYRYVDWIFRSYDVSYLLALSNSVRNLGIHKGYRII